MRRREIVMKLICGSLFFIRHHSYRQLSICPSLSLGGNCIIFPLSSYFAFCISQLPFVYSEFFLSGASTDIPLSNCQAASDGIFPSLFHPTSRCHPQQKEIKTKNCTLSWLFNTKLNLICFSVVQSLSFFVSFAFIWHVCCLIEREIAVDWLFCMQCVICYRYCYCHFNCCLYFPLGYG